MKKEKEEPALECIAVMLNINYGYNKKLMERCRALHDYSYFIEKVRTGVRAGKTLEAAVDDAINYSLREGILKDILRKNRAEVKRVVLTEYNEELHLDNVRKEGYEQGLEQGLERGLEQGIEQGLAMGYDRGKTMQLIHIIAKKVKKKQSLELISEAMEEDPEKLKPIYDAVIASAPDYDEDKAYQILIKNICNEQG